MKSKSLGFIGGGRITKIFLQGFKNKRFEFPTIVVCDTNPDTLSDLKEAFPEIKVTDSALEAAAQEIVLIALHPPVIGDIIPGIKDAIGNDTLVISLAPKFDVEKLSILLGTNRIVRMIPNATSIINRGYNPMYFSPGLGFSEKSEILESMEVLGKTFETEEAKLEAYAIVSAMLPTYFWFQWLEMQEIAQKIGLTENESKETVYDTTMAAMNLLYCSRFTSEEVIDLIPVKPISEHEPAIKEMLDDKLVALFEKIKP